MPKNKTEKTLRKFSVERGANKKTPLAKLVVPQVPSKDIVNTISNLLAEATTAIPEIERARATVTLY